MTASFHVGGSLVVVSFFGIALSTRLEVDGGEDLESHVYQTNNGSAPVDNIYASHQEDRLCHWSVENAVAASEGREAEGSRLCQCDQGSYVVGSSEHCRSAEKVQKFSMNDFFGHACRCEELVQTLCSNMVEGSVLRNTHLSHVEDGEQCKCQAGSWVTGSSEHCSPPGDQVRKFDPHQYNGCHCQWNYNHLPDWRDHIEAFWHDLMETDNHNGIEPRCRPFIEGSGERGLVLLMHGATACSGWWYLVKDQLVRDGWMVVATTHIGHGRAPAIVRGEHWSVTDYLADMPVNGRAFIEYSDELNRAMKKYHLHHPHLEMVIVGHSIGGALTTNMVIEEPELWDRVLLMNPFYAPSALPAHLDRTLLAAVVSVALPTAQWVLGQDDIRWSEGCDALRLQPDGGHGGMCHFTLAHLGAWLQLGDIVQQKAEALGSEHGVFTGGVGARTWGLGRWVATHLDGQDQRTSPVKAQILTSAGDGAVENANVHFMSRMFRSWARGGSSFCVFPREFTHNWVAPVDFPWVDHWWLDHSRTEHHRTAIDLVADFVRDGTPVPVNGTVPDDEGDGAIVNEDLCDIRQAPAGHDWPDHHDFQPAW